MFISSYVQAFGIVKVVFDVCTNTRFSKKQTIRVSNQVHIYLFGCVHCLLSLSSCIVCFFSENEKLGICSNLLLLLLFSLFFLTLIVYDTNTRKTFPVWHLDGC